MNHYPEYVKENLICFSFSIKSVFFCGSFNGTINGRKTGVY